MHGSISIEMLLVSSPKDVVVSDLAADPANGVFQRRHSERWQVNQPRLCYSSNTLSSAAQGEFDQLISGKGIVFNIDTWTTLQQTCLSQQPRVQFFRSLNLLGEDRASEKLMCPSRVQLGDTPGCGKLLKPVLPPLVGNCEWGPRLIAVS